MNATLNSEPYSLPPAVLFGSKREESGDHPWFGPWVGSDGALYQIMKFRFYGSSTGRFLRPDNIVTSITNPQGWNRYNYVLGNPVNLRDPSGHAGTWANRAYKSYAGNWWSAPMTGMQSSFHRWVGWALGLSPNGRGLIAGVNSPAFDGMSWGQAGLVARNLGTTIYRPPGLSGAGDVVNQFGGPFNLASLFPNMSGMNVLVYQGQESPDAPSGYEHAIEGAARNYASEAEALGGTVELVTSFSDACLSEYDLTILVTHGLFSYTESGCDPAYYLYVGVLLEAPVPFSWIRHFPLDLNSTVWIGCGTYDALAPSYATFGQPSYGFSGVVWFPKWRPGEAPGPVYAEWYQLWSVP